MKYLDLETSRYLLSLGCTSESGMLWIKKYYNMYPENKEWELRSVEWAEGEDDTRNGTYDHVSHLEDRKKDGTVIPAFSLSDLLRKDVAEKVWGTGWMSATIDVLRLFQTVEDWPKEISTLLVAPGRFLSWSE